MTDIFNQVNWQELLQTHGYWIILVGTFLEGETVVLLAGILVAGGQLTFEGVAGCAFIGSLLGDQLAFCLGKYKGSALLARFPRLDRKRELVAQLLRKYDTFLILGFRFVYGVRNITPLVLGMSGISYRRFLVWNLAGAFLWALLFTIVGSYFGEAAGHILRLFGRDALFAFLALILLPAGIYLFIRRRRAQSRLSS